MLLTASLYLHFKHPVRKKHFDFPKVGFFLLFRMYYSWLVFESQGQGRFLQFHLFRGVLLRVELVFAGTPSHTHNTTTTHLEALRDNLTATFTAGNKNLLTVNQTWDFIISFFNKWSKNCWSWNTKARRTERKPKSTNECCSKTVLKNDGVIVKIWIIYLKY